MKDGSSLPDMQVRSCSHAKLLTGEYVNLIQDHWPIRCMNP
jgi:hypothetical protein